MAFINQRGWIVHTHLYYICYVYLVEKYWTLTPHIIFFRMAWLRSQTSIPVSLLIGTVTRKPATEWVFFMRQWMMSRWTDKCCSDYHNKYNYTHRNMSGTNTNKHKQTQPHRECCRDNLQLQNDWQVRFFFRNALIVLFKEGYICQFATVDVHWTSQGMRDTQSKKVI